MVGSARDNGLWICAGTSLLKYQADGRLVPKGRVPAGRERIEARVLLEADNGAVWIGTAASGLFEFSAGTFAPVSVSHGEILCLAEDQEGNIWVGTGGGGLNRLRPRPLELLGADSGLPAESVRSICEDSSGALWVTTQNGLLVRRRAGNWVTMSADPSWPGGHATCVEADPHGGVWIGTRDDGLYRFKDGRFQTWQKRDGLSGENIRSLLVDSKGGLWITLDSPYQIQCLRQGQFYTYDLPQTNRSMRGLAEDAAGIIWAGSSDGQLFRVADGKLVSEPATRGSGAKSIRCLYPGSDGSLWIGHAGWGVSRLKEGRLVRVDAAQGLLDNHISQIIADDRGWLWFAGNRGIFQVREQELLEVMEGRAERVRSIEYGRGEGLPNLQANYGHHPGAVRRRDGTLWFSMRTGLAVVHPSAVREDVEPPPVRLDRVTVDGRVLAVYDSGSPLRPAWPPGTTDLRPPNATLDLRPDHRKIDFEFTALSFTAPLNVHFRYRLEGFDDDWIEAGNRRVANYGRLSAGNYRFRVLACNHLGIWNEAGAALGLSVMPFFWQTAWFRIGAFLLFTGGMVAAVRYVSFRRLRRQMLRLEQQAALHAERARIAKDIHDDVGANLTQIALLSELARQDRDASDRASVHIEKISTNARQAVKSLDEIVGR